MWYIAGIQVVPRNHGLVVSAFFFTTVAFVVVGMRTFTRAILVKNMGADDVLMLVALLGTLAFLATVFQQIKYGLGDKVGPEELQEFLKALYTTVVAYNFTQLSVKFSILFQYRRIFRTDAATRIVLGLLMWLAVFSAFCLSTSIFTCWPVAKFWNPAIPGGCIDRTPLHYTIAGFNIVNDIVILVAPVPWLRNLQITFRAKLVLMGIFTCGAFAAVVAIVRLHSLYATGSAPVQLQPLFGVEIAIWSGLEINIAIICASVPALKALFIKIIPRLGSYYKSTHNRYGRSTTGNFPLQSFDNRTGNFTQNAGDGTKIEIKVQRSIEMKSIPIEDDDSQKGLVTEGAWAAGHEARRKEGEDLETGACDPNVRKSSVFPNP